MKTKALLFINGTPPKQLPDISPETMVACTDGAYHYLKKMLEIERIDFISGDWDSYAGVQDIPEEVRRKMIYTPDQDFTDFYKALDILKAKGIREVVVYGGSGGEQDHFLGNLSVAYRFRAVMDIVFEDEYAQYFFIPPFFEIQGVKGKMISLYPFPKAEGITTQGLQWQLNDGVLDITERIGTRNRAIENKITIEYRRGALLIFIGKT